MKETRKQANHGAEIRPGRSAHHRRIVLPNTTRIVAAVAGRLGRQEPLLERDAAAVAHVAGEVVAEEVGPNGRLALEAFGAGQGAPILTVEGLPLVDVATPTPASGFCDDVALLLLNAMMLGVLRVMGLDPVHYVYENDRRLIRNVVPNPLQDESLSSHGSKLALGWHTDNPTGFFEGIAQSRPYGGPSPIPYVLGFTPVRNPAAVPTRVLPAAAVNERLSPDVLAALLRPEFDVAAPESNAGSGSRDLKAVPLAFEGPFGRVQRFNSDGDFEGITRSARHAVQAVKHAMVDAADDVVVLEQMPGSMSFIRNYEVYHGRPAFVAQGDVEGARWLRRVYACKDIRNGSLSDIEHWPQLWK